MAAGPSSQRLVILGERGGGMEGEGMERWRRWEMVREREGGKGEEGRRKK